MQRNLPKRKRKKKTMVYICMLLSEMPTQLPWFIILRKSMTKAKQRAMHLGSQMGQSKGEPTAELGETMPELPPPRESALG